MWFVVIANTIWSFMLVPPQLPYDLAALSGVLQAWYKYSRAQILQAEGHSV